MRAESTFSFCHVAESLVLLKADCGCVSSSFWHVDFLGFQALRNRTEEFLSTLIVSLGSGGVLFCCSWVLFCR